MGDCSKREKELHFLYDMPSHYFKSCFARSVINDSKNQSRSLDYNSTNIIALNEERDIQPSGSCSLSYIDSKLCKQPEVFKNYHTSTYDAEHLKERVSAKTSDVRNQRNDVPINWKLKEETKRKGERAQSQDKTTLEDSVDTETDMLRLRKECRGLMEENRRLQTALAARSPGDLVDKTLLQSQVDTLSWQLKQTESSRQMYREVMEQVVRFLERTHKNLDILQQKLSPGNASTEPQCRVPRSRSVHTVDVSPSRASPRSDSVLHFPRAKSIAQIEASQNYSTFRDFTWRRPRKSHSDAEGVPPEKLSQEAFRLLRIVQSLLNTREPDLTQHLNSSCNNTSRNSAYMPPHANASQRSSATSAVFDLPEEKELSFSFDRKMVLEDNISPSALSCSSPIQNSCGILQESLDASSIHSSPFKPTQIIEYNSTSLTSGLEAEFSGDYSKQPSSSTFRSSTNQVNAEVNPLAKQQLSEDESGFSSMSSFQEVGIPLVTPPTCSPTSTSINCYQEVGLPVVDHSLLDTTLPSTSHRRWNSSPVNTQLQYPPQNTSFCLPQETLHVLWV